ncbi:sporulation integral membrane protein YtvI [Salirhabdus salicampi]|uniref:sporulation integral membrane protein YtvI n=1 Tax=Salirhabdus salicampi TaxID=476102 RepID=UPI0020C55BDD|nr:sporulation integral membrane protein YtvI [Salirhabdus salicampi]MCP8616636.1 sporulation integral membrane protein YtvI [Salirhabdus salicampi]
MFKLTKSQLTKILLFILAILIILFILPISIPLILALFTALVLNPVVKLLVHKVPINRKISVMVVFILFLIIMSTIGFYLTTKAVSQLVKLTENAPHYINQVSLLVNDWQEDINNFAEDLPTEVVTEFTTTIDQNLSAMKTKLSSNVTIENLASIVAKIPEYIVSILVYLIALFLFMLEIPRLKEKIYSVMTEQTAQKFSFMTSRLSYVIFGFFKAQLLVSIFIFAVSLIGLLYIAPDVAIIMSLIIWVIDFIPIIGSIVVLGPWALYMFLASDPITGSKLAILAVILLAIRRTVEPKVMGRHIGLSPLATLIAMYLGLQLLGVFGFFLGPIFVIIFNSAREAGIIKLNVKI